MESSSQTRHRNTHVISLSNLPRSKKDNEPVPTSLPKLLLTLRDAFLQNSTSDDESDPVISNLIESISTQIERLADLSQPSDILDTAQEAWRICISDLLSITTRPTIFSSSTFQKLFLDLADVEDNLDYEAMFESNPAYARTVCFRSFDMLSLPLIDQFLKQDDSSDLDELIAFILRAILLRIQSTTDSVVFKRNELQQQSSIIGSLMQYVDRNVFAYGDQNTSRTLDRILSFVWDLTDDTILVPNLIEADCHSLALKWISNSNISLKMQEPCLHILHNVARHEKGVKALNDEHCLLILREFKSRVIDPNRDNPADIYTELPLLYAMVFSLLTEAKETPEDLNNLRKILDQLMQLAINAGQEESSKHDGFHVSEPIVVLTKLCVHDEILNYVLNESSVRNRQAKSNVEFFCEMVIKFRGAIAGDDDLDQLTLIALLNIVWSISFHDQYQNQLKSNTKLLMTIKSLANDDGEARIEQYVPHHMSSVPKAASGILWNLDEDNPAHAAPAPAPPTQKKEEEVEERTVSNRMRVMVSYCHVDSEFCHQLVDALKKDNRFDIWVDFAYCHTDDLWEEIAEAIEKASVILFVMSKDYQDSKSCRQEVMYAKDSLKKRFIPINTKKDFVPTGWLGVRVVGPQYVRFGKRTFEQTVQELIKLIVDDRKTQEPEKPTVIKPLPADENILLTSAHNPNALDTSEPTVSDVKPPTKPLAQWRKTEISQWFDHNQVPRELIDVYDFHHGTDVLLYGQCLRPDWQVEYESMKERYQRKHNRPLYRDHFVRFVGAVHRLPSSKPEPSTVKSKSCAIS